MRVGSGKFTYEEQKNWGQFPISRKAIEINGIAVDSQDRVYAFTRGDHPVIVFDRHGKFLSSWGHGQFVRPHGIAIGPDDMVYCADDNGHAIFKFTLDGKLLMKIETQNNPSDTGYVTNKPDTIVRAGPPFNRPTYAVSSKEGNIYVADGYGNARVHKFGPDGKLLLSWGQPGVGPGQFKIPHGLSVDSKGQIYVCDRLNMRIQIFADNGEYIGQFGDVHFPNSMSFDSDGNMYVNENGGIYLFPPEPCPDKWYARVTVRDSTGKVLVTWNERDPRGEGKFFSPHCIAVDSRGDIYLGEIPVTYTHGLAPHDWPTLRKYVRQ